MLSSLSGASEIDNSRQVKSTSACTQSSERATGRISYFGTSSLGSSNLLERKSGVEDGGGSSGWKGLQYRIHDDFLNLAEDRDPKCPPCFNCMLPSFSCLQYGTCNEYDGQCLCPEGYGGLDCSKPLDGSLADGKDRYPRESNQTQCKEGWTGLTCNGMYSGHICSECHA